MDIETAQRATDDGRNLATAISEETDRLSVPYPVLMHAICFLLAAYLLDTDSSFSVLEVSEGTIHTDDQKLQHVMDEVKELAEAGRNRRMELQQQKEGADGGTEQKH